MNFSNYYNFDPLSLELYEIPVDFLLTEAEIPASVLMKNTDQGRGYRGLYDVQVKKTWDGKTEKNIWWLNYKFRSEPSVQHKNHFGYVMWKEQGKLITAVYCTCMDFQFRLYYPFVQKGLAKWDVDTKYANKTTLTTINQGKIIQHPFKHNRTNGKGIMNTSPDRLYVCKHLYSAIHGYVLGKMKSERMPEQEHVPVQQKIINKKEEEVK